jgi:uncharacterized membrane protein
MKKTIGIVATAAFAIAAVSAPVAAKDKGIDAGEPYCFGQVHKAVNAGALDGIDNVGQLVKALGGGQDKNAAANGFCVVLD